MTKRSRSMRMLASVVNEPKNEAADRLQDSLCGVHLQGYHCADRLCFKSLIASPEEVLYVCLASVAAFVMLVSGCARHHAAPLLAASVTFSLSRSTACRACLLRRCSKRTGADSS